MDSLHIDAMHALNGIDYGIIGIIGISVLMGIVRGFVREAMSLMTWIIAITVATLYCERVSVYFHGISLPAVRLLIAFVLLALAVLIVGGIITHLMTKIIKSTGFSITDRIIGTLFGFARGAAIVGIAVLIGSSSSVAQSSLWKTSVLIPSIQPVAVWIRARIPQHLLEMIPKSQVENGEAHS